MSPFPADAGEDEEVRNATSVIRLITRLIFVWFIKEKGLVPDELFNKRHVDDLLRFNDPNESVYYKAILQNLFFATLNQEMNTPDRPQNRKFRNKANKSGGRDQHYMIHNVYRYQDYFKQPDEALRLFSNIPFLNGGLFECLDRPDKGNPAKVLRIDGFSDRKDNELIVPDFLFFSEEMEVDLNKSYGTKNKLYRVRGLIDIFDRYKFTINENTPIEEEVALDPELLGKVFENLLAAYNPETGATARKQTGSFYTPREIVNYMVDESLTAYLTTSLMEHHESRTILAKSAPPAQINIFGKAEPRQTEIIPQRLKLSDGEKLEIDQRVRNLFSYSEGPNLFSDQETSRLIEAIDSVKILDPACGSGAFPMGILHKLVFILRKLDPGNAQWKQRQVDKVFKAMKAAEEIEDSSFRQNTIQELEKQIANINDAFERNELDYGRKLYLIENCIYGVDIQPIAVQIAKLRFFISLVVDQKTDDTQENRGILPLPNLETKFVAANALLGIDKPAQLFLRNPAIDVKEMELGNVRRRHFIARTPKTKAKYRECDTQLRIEISDLLRQDGLPRETTEKLARWDLYDQNASADFFDPEWMFGITDGFDVVIGNPPYVRQEKIKELKPGLKEHYECYTSIADLYVYFFESGYKALKSGGILTYISSNKYFRSGYGKKLRNFLSTKAMVHQLIDFGDAPIFTSIAYPSIITLSRKKPNLNETRVLTWEPGPSLEEFASVFYDSSFAIPQKELGDDGWRLESPVTLRLLKKLRNAGMPLGEYVNGRFYRGILTGLNEAFVVDRSVRDQLISDHPSSSDVLKPFLRGKDVKRWTVEFADQYLIKIESSRNKQHPWSGKSLKDAEKIFAKTYPAIHARFETFRDKLIARDDQGQYFWELRSCAYWKEFEEPKVIYPDIAKAPEFAYDDEGYYLANTMYLLPSKTTWLLGLLNSNVVFWFYIKTSSQIRGGFARFIAQYVTQIPIPKKSNFKSIESGLKQIISTKRDDPIAIITALEAELDARVAHLYQLSEEEYSLILSQLKIPEPFCVAALSFYRDIVRGKLK